MMKLKETLFGILTAVSLAVVAPYANADEFYCKKRGETMYVELYSNGEFEGRTRSAREYVYGEVDGASGQSEFEGHIYRPKHLRGYVICYQ